MKILLQKSRPIIILICFISLLVSWFYLPGKKDWMSITLIITSIGIASVLTIQRHWQCYQQAEYTREKMISHLTLELPGVLLAISTAMFVGRLAGAYVGLRAGFWIGLLAGFAGGFFAAWAVRSAWGRLVLTRI